MIRLRTNFTPPVTLDETHAGGINVLRFLQPSVDVDVPFLKQPLHYAPAGEPTGWGVAFFAAILGLAGYGFLKLIKR